MIVDRGKLILTAILLMAGMFVGDTYVVRPYFRRNLWDFIEFVPWYLSILVYLTLKVSPYYRMSRWRILHLLGVFLSGCVALGAWCLLFLSGILPMASYAWEFAFFGVILSPITIVTYGYIHTNVLERAFLNRGV